MIYLGVLERSLFCDRITLGGLHRVEGPQVRRTEKPKIYPNFLLCTYLICILDILVNTITTLRLGPGNLFPGSGLQYIPYYGFLNQNRFYCAEQLLIS